MSNKIEGRYDKNQEFKAPEATGTTYELSSVSPRPEPTATELQAQIAKLQRELELAEAGDAEVAQIEKELSNNEEILMSELAIEISRLQQSLQEILDEELPKYTRKKHLLARFILRKGPDEIDNADTNKIFKKIKKITNHTYRNISEILKRNKAYRQDLPQELDPYGYHILTIYYTERSKYSKKFLNKYITFINIIISLDKLTFPTLGLTLTRTEEFLQRLIDDIEKHLKD